VAELAGGAGRGSRVTEAVAADRVDALLARRLAAGEAWFAAEADRLARLCREMASRFAAGGRLLAIGDVSDARHVAVEFVHPVIVGKRALPAIAVTPRQLDLLAEPRDMVIGFGADVSALAARGCLAVELEPPVDDPYVRQELVETAYHVLWELVHVFLEHSERSVHDTGAASFLYPFLGEQETDEDAVLEDVRRSILMKAEEVGALREQTLSEGRATLLAAAEAMRAGGRVLALGNGGSATDATDVVADLQALGRPAIDLTDDPAILTAIANDIGVEAIFARQVIAYGRPGDALLALSTSGGSGNVIVALAEARRRGMATIALVGYEGGQIAAERLADLVVITRSQHIPRIQEAQASAYHVLCELVGRAA
jgi:D-sedoheptulose 7-phosphate isomerase